MLAPSIFVGLAHADTCTSGNCLANPLTVKSVSDFVSMMLKVLVMVSLPIISVFIVLSGFKFVLAQGKPDDLKKARTNFMYVILGSLLILGAWVLANIIGSTVSQIVSG